MLVNLNELLSGTPKLWDNFNRPNFMLLLFFISRLGPNSFGLEKVHSINGSKGHGLAQSQLNKFTIYPTEIIL